MRAVRTRPAAAPQRHGQRRACAPRGQAAGSRGAAPCAFHYQDYRPSLSASAASASAERATNGQYFAAIFEFDGPLRRRSAHSERDGLMRMRHCDSLAIVSAASRIDGTTVPAPISRTTVLLDTRSAPRFACWLGIAFMNANLKRSSLLCCASRFVYTKLLSPKIMTFGRTPARHATHSTRNMSAPAHHLPVLVASRRPEPSLRWCGLEEASDKTRACVCHLNSPPSLSTACTHTLCCIWRSVAPSSVRIQDVLRMHHPQATSHPSTVASTARSRVSRGFQTERLG